QTPHRKRAGRCGRRHRVDRSSLRALANPAASPPWHRGGRLLRVDRKSRERQQHEGESYPTHVPGDARNPRTRVVAAKTTKRSGGDSIVRPRTVDDVSAICFARERLKMKPPFLSSIARLVLRACLLVCAISSAHADDWPQWLGPQRDGVWRETGIIGEFPAAGPKVRWRAPVGGGFAGPAVAKGRVYVADRRLAQGAHNPSDPFARGEIPGTERVLCLDEADGRILWK